MIWTKIWNKLGRTPDNTDINMKQALRRDVHIFIKKNMLFTFQFLIYTVLKILTKQ